MKGRCIRAVYTPWVLASLALCRKGQTPMATRTDVCFEGLAALKLCCDRCENCVWRIRRMSRPCASGSCAWPNGGAMHERSVKLFKLMAVAESRKCTAASVWQAGREAEMPCHVSAGTSAVCWAGSVAVWCSRERAPMPAVGLCSARISCQAHLSGNLQLRTARHRR